MADKPQSSAIEIMESLGDAIDQIEVFHNQLLVAVHIKSERTAGGIIRPQSNIDEDKWQGKVGLVVKKGPIAFLDDARNSFNGQNVHEGQWVMFRVSEAPAIKVNDVMCRLVEDIHVRGTVTDPEIIW